MSGQGKALSSSTPPKIRGGALGSSPLPNKALKNPVVWGLESGPERARVLRLGDDKVNGVHGLEGAGIELLRVQFWRLSSGGG